MYRVQIDYNFNKNVLGMYSCVDYVKILDDIIDDEQIDNMVKVLKQNNGKIKISIIDEYYKLTKYIVLIEREYNGVISEYLYDDFYNCNIKTNKLTVGTIKKMCQQYNIIINNILHKDNIINGILHKDN